ncbi:MAG: zinc ribbon domain-containing protein [Clostridiales bacterium]|nr:zinc ribbon domain-containing protein [Clostridiales bacterium]
MAFEVPFCNTFPLYDPKYRNLFVSINGSLLVESDDPRQNVPGSYQTVSAASNLAKIATADTVMKFGSIGYKDITARYGELVNNIVSALKKRGFTVVGASIDPVTPDDSSMKRIQKQDEAEKMTSDPAAMAAQMRVAQEEAMRTQAAQPFSQPAVQPSFAAAPVAAPVSAPAQVPAAAPQASAAPVSVPAQTPAPAPVAASVPAPAPAPAAPAQPQLMKFCIRCGTLASGTKFCTNCGSSLIRKS